eukprot:scaffold31_cov132-Skeletonema_menzelii.AAC.4
MVLQSTIVTYEALEVSSKLGRHLDGALYRSGSVVCALDGDNFVTAGKESLYRTLACEKFGPRTSPCLPSVPSRPSFSASSFD